MMFAGVMVMVAATGCTTTPVAGPVADTAVELKAVSIDDRALKGKKVTLTERRDDGAWSVTYLYDDRFGRWDSRVVVTDWLNEQHYDVTALEDIRVKSGAWESDGSFAFQGWSSQSVTLVFPEQSGDDDLVLLVDNLRDTSLVNPGPPVNMAGYALAPAPNR
ncbi:hypothetical protein F3N42_04385 [Marinihelvus fidelis]|uniref:Uncharacterized protein n=2 Tax=Marinihelvus fidelis TaxID=2613842 RepID=A0A5N0TBL7_9GAMM|nr:hypothetical protein F3N42_04385 [Marinihelvus fidelis]